MMSERSYKGLRLWLFPHVDRYLSAAHTSEHQYENHQQQDDNSSESGSAIHRLFVMRDPGS